MELTFCTLFDKNYLYKGLALHQSLLHHAGDFRLWVLCMDEVTYRLLQKMELHHVKLIPIAEFETDTLRQLKPNRTIAEYYWTCTAPLMQYVMQHDPETPHVAYLDADLFFYSPLDPIYAEFANNSTLIIPHRYSPDRVSWEAESGKYNVSMVIFRQDLNGREALDWWSEQCILACYHSEEHGYLGGDQKYLDDWLTRFQQVVELQHIGANVAPWNLQQYQLIKRGNILLVNDLPLIFYHFHALRILDHKPRGRYLIQAATGYRFTRQQLKYIYQPYADALRSAIERVHAIDPQFHAGYATLSWKGILREMYSGNLVI